MGRQQEIGMEFTGEGNTRVRDFLRWMNSWFATMGEEFSGETPQSKRRRAARLHLACPARSVAGRFINGLESTVLWDEELLRKALTDRFHDAEREDQVDEDILTRMSTLSQGEQDVFKYSHKVLKMLQRKSSRMDHYDRILIGYYLDGLSNRRLREMAILSFRRQDSQETPSQVVKGVIRLATQLRFKGYRKRSNRRSRDDDEDEDEDEGLSSDSADSSGSDGNDDDDDDDDEGLYYHRSRKRRSKTVATAGRSGEKKGRKAKSKGGKDRATYDEGRVSGEVRELREMMRDLMQLQKAAATPRAQGTGERTEEDIIPLDTYAIGEGYGRNPYRQPHYDYAGPHQLEYPNRRGQVTQSAEHRPERMRPHPVPPRNTRQEMGQIPHPTCSYFDDFTRQPVQNLRPSSDLLMRGYPPSRIYGGAPGSKPIVGPDGLLYYPPRPRICYHCQEEGHLRWQCPQLQGIAPRTGTLRPEHPDILAGPRREQQDQAQDRPVNAVDVVAKSSALEGMKVRKVTAATGEDLVDLKDLIHQVSDVDNDDSDSEIRGIDAEGSSWEDEEAEPVMAGERARRFSELPPEFEGEEGRAVQRRRTEDNDDDVIGITPGKGKIRTSASKTPRKPIRMMVGREGFDFVGAFRDAPVTGLNWGSFFDLAPTVKRDICHLLVQERAKSMNKGKGKGKEKGKIVTLGADAIGAPGEGEALAIATDRDLGDVVNFYTKGILRTGRGKYRISRVLVDAGSVVNLMPIHLLRSIGAKLQKAGGMVIRTATNALAEIAHCADIRITVAGVSCDLQVYALPEEYKPTYPLLLSRRWLQAVKAKGDYASGQYYIMHAHGTRVRIPQDKNTQINTGGRRPRIPVVMRDKKADRCGVSAEIEEELEWQRFGGSHFFEDLVRLIKRQAKEQIRREEYVGDEEESEFSDQAEN
ncbi:hypothetical protein HOY82DRAFT_617744 [Tuber indicum]|nr:hypothetical protein HOY82DRAFT_617744 [Tuber indicum]